MASPPTGRQRPALQTTVSREVDAAVRARASAAGVALGHVVEDLLRVALGLPPVVEPGTVAA